MKLVIGCSEIFTKFINSPKLVCGYCDWNFANFWSSTCLNCYEKYECIDIVVGGVTCEYIIGRYSGFRGSL